MNAKNSKEHLLDIIQSFERIDRITNASFPEVGIIFGNTSIETPRIEHAEFGFIKVVSWFYVYLVEKGNISIDFLIDKFNAYKITDSNAKDEFPTRIQSFRTYFQHNLDFNQKHGVAIITTCQNWLSNKCGTPIPETVEQWSKCLIELLNEGQHFLELLQKTIREIEKDESKGIIISEWVLAIKRYHPAYEFDQLISVVTKDMGREHIQPEQLRKRFISQWQTELKILRWPYSFDTEARKLIEKVLLNEDTMVLPITGKDVMKFFNISPGPEVGNILQKAKILYSQRPCSAEILLKQLKD